MKKVKKLCGTQRREFYFHEEKKPNIDLNIQYSCKKCARISRDLELLCYAEVIKEKK
jgi:hypothetical protein